MIWIATAILVTLLVTTQQGDCSNKRLLTSTYGIPCNDECGFRGKSYNWCITDKGWDYCSTQFNVDYENKKCNHDSLCRRRNKGYTWCYNEAGSWGYCSREPVVLSHKTIYGVQCVDECVYSDSKGYYCYTSDSWNYCSILPDRTYTNAECQKECEKKDGYYRCTTGYVSWDYCGPIEKGECEYKPLLRSRQLVCTPTDGRQIDLAFREAVFATLNRNLRNDVTALIQDMDIGALYRERAGTITRTDNFRVDLQGMFDRGGRRYRNLQIQHNILRQPGQNTTVAHVELPVMQNNESTIPDEQVRLAFQTSLDRLGTITIGFLN